MRNPHLLPTFLVAGTWRHHDGSIELAPFEPLDAATVRELREEAERLAAFHARAPRARSSATSSVDGTNKHALDRTHPRAERW